MEKDAFNELYEIIKKLRHENAWDMEQTPQSMTRHLLEETYEAIDAIGKGNVEHVKEELGDVLLIILMISYMYEQKEEFTFLDVLTSISEKLKKRLPHIFSNQKENLTSSEVLSQWNKIKKESREEPSEKDDSILADIPDLPPLLKSVALKNEVAKIGFDWETIEGVMEKLDEEVQEVKEAIAKDDRANMEEEIGDVLFVLMNVAEKLNIDAEYSLISANKKFEKRFRYVEKRMKEEGVPLSKENLDKMEEFWQEIKRKEHEQ
ncbi:MAG: nucleoside triphosphate pyrophosphohydrolase [Treponema sp.]